MKHPSGLEHFQVFEGDLYDNRKEHEKKPLRRKFEWHFSRISNVSQFKATLRAGKVTTLGCYPLYFITHDGAALCFDCAKKQFRQVVWDFMHKTSTGWRVVACDVNWESTDTHCDHCSEKIPSAYGDDEEETTKENE